MTLSLRFSCSEIDSHVIARVGRVDAERRLSSAVDGVDTAGVPTYRC